MYLYTLECQQKIQVAVKYPQQQSESVVDASIGFASEV